MKRLILLVLFVAILSVAAFANTSATVLPITATLLSTVSVSTTNLDFGTFTLNGGNRLSNATVTVQATAGTNYAITMDCGLHYNGIWRGVNNGAYVIYYEILDPSNEFEWSDVGYADTYDWGFPVFSTGTGFGQTFIANGTLFVNQADPASQPGLYYDVVIVTVNY